VGIHQLDIYVPIRVSWPSVATSMNNMFPFESRDHVSCSREAFYRVIVGWTCCNQDAVSLVIPYGCEERMATVRFGA